MSNDEKVVVQIMKTADGIMHDIRPCEMTLVSKGDGGIIHIELGDGTGIEFMANSMIVAMTHLILGQEEDR